MQRLSGMVVAIGFVLLLGVGVLAASLIFGSGAQQPGTGPGPQSGSSAGASGELILLGSDPPTLDPHLAGDTASAEYIVEVFSGLVTLDNQLRVQPDLADSWKVSDDGKTYTFTLNPNAKFHSGRAVTAEDVKYSIERAADPKTQSTTADAYLGDIVGVKDKLASKASEVAGVKVLDSRTVQIQIDEPKAYFLAKMTYPTAFVVDKANVESGRAWTDKPNGTGPFTLKEWRKGERIILERNPDHFRTPPKLERLVFNLAGGSSMTMYENDEIAISGVGINDIERVLDTSNPLNKELKVHDELSTFYIGFNNKTAPFDDKLVRQAFSHALDKERIIEVVLKGLLQPAYTILPPGMPGYSANLPGLRYDPEKARQLLAQSKYAGKLPEITMIIPGQASTPPPTVEAMVEMWKQNLGVDVKIQQVEWATFLQEVKPKTAGQGGKYQMYQLGWIADYADPQDFLDILFHCQSLENNGAYCNRDADKLLEQARVEQDIEKRLALYQQVEQMIVQDAPWLPTWHGRSYLVVKPWVKGYQPAAMVVPTYARVAVER
ncbi:MAG: peptide ABC transporter substrate-binding protein [Chloroflexi bacterium]|nr:peptide ABC transporter substrate-binding protein [Chloroflexota bacterium]